eukprot:gene7197-9662_t
MHVQIVLTMLVVTCLLATLELVTAEASVGNTSHIEVDEYGSMRISSPNSTHPLFVNKYDVFKAISNTIQCIQIPCPPQYYRTGEYEYLQRVRGETTYSFKQSQMSHL